MQILIRLLLKEPSDQGLHCLPLHPHLLQAYSTNTVTLFNIKSKFSGFQKFKKFMVLLSVHMN